VTTNSELISRFEGHANRYSEREVEKDKIHIDKVVEDLKELFSIARCTFKINSPEGARTV
jgi:hypothetical protein